MRSQTGNSKMHRIRTIVLCSAIASLGLTSCAAEQNRLTGLSPAPYFALSSGAQPAALARRSGTFAAVNGCVVFKPADSSAMLTPVFRKGQTALVTDGTEWLGLYVNGAPVVLGDVYRLSGASESHRDKLTLESPAPAGCPTGYFVVRSVGKAVADANVSRFCAGVTICRSFALD